MSVPADPWVLLPPADVVARAIVGPAPRMPLASLHGAVTAHHDTAGEIRDWVLDPAAIDNAGIVGTYRAWRSTWRPEWPLGPVTNLASLCREMADIDHDLDRRLERILERVAQRGQTVAVPGAATDALLRELETARLALSVDDRVGWGIVDDMPAESRSGGLARTWAAPPNDQVLAGTGGSAVVVRPSGGLVLAERVDDRASAVSIAAVDLRHDEVVVVDPRGGSAHLPLARCRPLGWLVPRSLRWHVREIPLVVVWSLLFQGLPEALRAARDTGGWVEIVPGE
ncbi:MAG: hypothetical protein ACOYL9_13350 [Ilumatobacteraceae bacterium]|jgi:hypothetical protein